MARCLCEYLGPQLQPHAHAVHTGAGQMVRQVAALAPRYLAALRRSRPRDPQIEAMVEQAQADLEQLHSVARKYLPQSNLNLLPYIDDAVREKLRTRRPGRAQQ